MMREGGGTRDGGRWPALSGGPEARGPAQEAPAPGGLWKSRPGGEGSAFADQAWKAQDPGPSSHPLPVPERGGSLRGRGCCVAARPFSASAFLFQVGGLAGPESLRSMKLLCLVAVVGSLLVLPAQANKVQLPCATTLPAPRHPGGASAPARLLTPLRAVPVHVLSALGCRPPGEGASAGHASRSGTPEVEFRSGFCVWGSCLSSQYLLALLLGAYCPSRSFQ